MTGDPFPVVMSATMSFIEAYSPAQLRHFNKYNIKGGTFKTEKIGKGGSGIGGIGRGSADMTNVVDNNALDGLSGVRGNVADSESTEISETISKKDPTETFADNVQKAKEKSSLTPGSIYTKAQSDVMSNNFSFLPDTSNIGFSNSMSDNYEQYKQSLKSPLVSQIQTEADKVNTNEEDISALINNVENREQKG